MVGFFATQGAMVESDFKEAQRVDTKAGWYEFIDNWKRSSKGGRYLEIAKDKATEFEFQEHIKQRIEEGNREGLESLLGQGGTALKEWPDLEDEACQALMPLRDQAIKKGEVQGTWADLHWSLGSSFDTTPQKEIPVKPTADQVYTWFGELAQVEGNNALFVGRDGSFVARVRHKKNLESLKLGKRYRVIGAYVDNETLTNPLGSFPVPALSVAFVFDFAPTPAAGCAK